VLDMGFMLVAAMGGVRAGATQLPCRSPGLGTLPQSVSCLCWSGAVVLIISGGIAQSIKARDICFVWDP
jgi:hypothetical protein